ncbi:hypothetical protein [Micromonospora carbonacea]|uniref:Uncharacterized protein n=1 Tax=Micromonospora carbonacea TaxID=47853 RepID=A0A1C5AI07_9ACTN|nr:hypothetical protein [Micromonospora carbonacea]SCF44847.1 hypothetical protein GA0070563_11351 [Micromonospora carbonacea]
MGETGQEELLRFVDELRRLRQIAGGPSLNMLVAAAQGRQPLARSTLSDKLNAKSLPDWDFVVAYVGACVAHAERTGVRLPAEATDLARWDAAHWRLLRAADAARPGERLGAAARVELGRAAEAERTGSPTPRHRPAGEWVVPRQLPAAAPPTRKPRCAS